MKMHRSFVLATLVLLVIALFSSVHSPVARAASMIVTSTADDTNDDGNCSLREAITNANNDAGTFDDCATGSGPDTITFNIPAADPGCTAAGVCTITLGSALADIAEDLTIDGEGQSITVSGNNAVRVLNVQSGITFNLQGGMIIADGNAGEDDGGGLLVGEDAIVLLENCIFTSNDADEGGAIHVEPNAQLVISDCTVDDNHALGEDGGGLRNDGGMVTIFRSTFSNNTAVDDGGGLDNRGGGVMYVVNSTISGNTAENNGGGFRSASEAQSFLFNVTITDNHSGNEGGGIADNQDSVITFMNSIVAGNTAAQDEIDATADCFSDDEGNLTSGGYNMVGDGTGCPLDTGDITVTPANVFVTELGPLANNGGPTETHALLSNSLAINAGRPQVDGGCVDQDDNPLTTDQRGEPRPVGPECDIGAYELQSSTAVNVTGPTGKLGKAGNVVVKWKTMSESHIAGFNVYRKMKNGQWRMHNAQFIQAKHSGAAQGTTYRFKDIKVKAGKLYRYKIQVIYTDSHSEWTSVIQVKVP